MTFEPHVEDRVAFTGPDTPEIALYNGHPGVIEIVDRGANVTGETYELVYVSFVSGPTMEVPAQYLTPLDGDEYQARGARLVRERHPIKDEDVFTIGAAGSEWPR